MDKSIKMKKNIFIISGILLILSCRQVPDMPCYQHPMSFGDSILKKFNPEVLVVYAVERALNGDHRAGRHRGNQRKILCSIRAAIAIAIVIAGHAVAIDVNAERAV